jgi:hypothetical protein
VRFSFRAGAEYGDSRPLAGTVRGFLVRSTPDSAWFLERRAAEPAPLAWAWVSSAEVQQGRRSNGDRGLIVGGLIGLAAGALLTSAVPFRSDEGQSRSGLVRITLAFAVAGTFVGALSSRPAWRRVPVDSLASR